MSEADSLTSSAADTATPDVGSGARSATRGALITTIGRAVRLLCNLIGLVVLARLLSAEDYGVVAMSGAVIGAAGIIGDVGVSLSALRSVTIERRERDALFWFGTLVGLALAVITAAVAPLVAAFYGVDAVRTIMFALSLNFVLSGAASQYRVDALRRGLYARLSEVEIVSAVASLALGIVLAVCGAGYWALVVQTLSTSALGLVLLVWSCGWLPGRPRRSSALRGHLGFGAGTSLTQVANYISGNVDSVAIGKLLGPAAVGLYSRGYQLFNLPVDQLTAPLTSLILPHLAKVSSDGLAPALLRAQRILSYFVLGICLALAAGGSALVTVMLGPGWGQVGLILQVLMAGAVFQISGYVYYWAFLTTGRVGLLFWCEVPPRLVMTGMVVVGASYGVVGAAAAHSAGLLLCYLVPTLFGVRRLGWRVRDFVLGPGRPVALYLASYGVAVAVRETASGAGWSDWAVLGTTLASVGATLAVAGLLVPVYRRDAIEIVHLLASARSRGA